jgi:hypothetical protein
MNMEAMEQLTLPVSVLDEAPPIKAEIVLSGKDGLDLPMLWEKRELLATLELKQQLLDLLPGYCGWTIQGPTLDKLSIHLHLVDSFESLEASLKDKIVTILRGV